MGIACINQRKQRHRRITFIMTRNTIFDYFRKSLNKVTMKITLEVVEKLLYLMRRSKLRITGIYELVSSTTTTRGFYHEQETTNDKQRNSRTT